MSDDTTGQDAGPTDAEFREYLAQLRPVPAAQVILETLSTTLTAAQAKLGRFDARLLIDLASVMVEQAGDHLPAEHAQQFDQVLSQLRFAQVQAENAVAESGADEPNDLPSAPATPAAPSDRAAAEPIQAPQPPAAPKLWVPGS